MSVQRALAADLQKLPSAIRESTMAAAAIELAHAIDNSESLRDLAAAVKELRATMESLEARAAQVPSEEDPIDKLIDAGPAGEPGATISYLSGRRG